MPRTRLVAALLLLSVVACGGEGQSAPIREGRGIYANHCSTCHGASGQGDVGPSFATVTETWPSCIDHLEWIALGSDGWRVAHGDTYGATDKPVTGGMPAHEDKLTLEERRLVAAYERSVYGGEEEAAALAECGVEAADG